MAQTNTVSVFVQMKYSEYCHIDVIKGKDYIMYISKHDGNSC